MHFGILNFMNNNKLILPIGFIIPSPFNKFYEVEEELGSGSFGIVYKVLCKETNEHLAIKIGLTNEENNADQLANEINTYRYINKHIRGDDIQYFGKYIQNFTIFANGNKYAAIIFELYRRDIYYFIKMRNDQANKKFVGFSFTDIQRVLRDVASGMKALHNIRIIHSDLKPENIAITDKGHAKIIDLGSSVPVQGNYCGYVQSRFYRAPETILRYNLTTAIDVWSFGCIAFELYFGVPLFYGENNLNMLQLMQIRLDKFPAEVIRNSPCSKDYFDENGNVKGVENVKERILFTSKKLLQIIFSKPTNQEEALENFYDLVKSCLEINPEKRISFNDITNHDFLNMEI